MGYRMALSCSCDDGHHYYELDDSFARCVWLDPDGVLAALGVASLSTLGERDEEAGEEEESVAIEPEAFADWLDAVARHRAAILDAIRARGGHPSGWAAWQERAFAPASAAYRDLAAHAIEVGATVDAAWA